MSGWTLGLVVSGIVVLLIVALFLAAMLQMDPRGDD